MLLASFFHTIINFDNFAQLLPLVYSSLVAAMILGVMAGLIGPMIQARDMAFAVHGTAELSFAGAACALWLGTSVTLGAVIGSVVAGMILAVMGLDGKNRNSLIGIMLPFGLGLGVLFLSLYQGRSSNKFGLLTGQIVAVSPTELQGMMVVAVIVLAVMAVFGRRMLFSAIDPQIAEAQHLNLKWLSLLFMLMLSLVVAVSVQFVGALLILSLLITPTASATQITARPLFVSLLSMGFAMTAGVGGILLSLGAGLPISPYITTISFLIYLLCWGVGTWRKKMGWNQRKI
ncbi:MULTISPECIES: metal ABC transporter permease [unclassified Moraxella]|uniref:metal ABC transporter permease n=1 Tax=unclassified Moraxella TaxID=2685852 RepID=UPI003AF7987A